MVLLIVLINFSCTKPPLLSTGHDVTSSINDSPWFGTGKAQRLVPVGSSPEAVRQFNLQFITDIDFPGNSSATRSPKITGCVEDCIPTQRLHIYNIPLRKGKFKISKLDKRRMVEQEMTNFWLLFDGGGMAKNYHYQGSTPAWVRITRYDRQSQTIEGRFAFTLDENKAIKNHSEVTSPISQFKEGQFRVKLVDVRLKQ
ncbi:hypothetical protein [Telluribacter sp.]|uniref:hypothetical protein n=1 Tax=Telluribacter sp. TaxID=1978767 RepID=UPI002E0E0EFB|nr:hypothetical protein [Telluribacter sp.]